MRFERARTVLILDWQSCGRVWPNRLPRQTIADGTSITRPSLEYTGLSGFRISSSSHKRLTRRRFILTCAPLVLALRIKSRSDCFLQNAMLNDGIGDLSCQAAILMPKAQSYVASARNKNFRSVLSVTHKLDALSMLRHARMAS